MSTRSPAHKCAIDTGLPVSGPKSRLLRRVVLLALGVATIGILIYVAAILHVGSLYELDFEPIPFDSASWIASQPEFSLDSLRLRMIDDLLATHNLVGMHRDEIVALIGEPDDTEYFREYEMVYYLGQERHPLGIDSEWLAIDLDTSSTSTFAGILRD